MYKGGLWLQFWPGCVWDDKGIPWQWVECPYADNGSLQRTDIEQEEEGDLQDGIIVYD